MIGSSQTMANRDAVLLLLLSKWKQLLNSRMLKGDPQRDIAPRFIPMAFLLTCELRKEGHVSAMWDTSFLDYQLKLGLDVLRSNALDANIKALIDENLIEKPTYYHLNYEPSDQGWAWLDELQVGLSDTADDGFPKANSRSLNSAINTVLAATVSLSLYDLRSHLFDTSFEIYRENRAVRNPFVQFDKRYATFDGVLDRRSSRSAARSF